VLRTPPAQSPRTIHAHRRVASTAANQLFRIQLDSRSRLGSSLPVWSPQIDGNGLRRLGTQVVHLIYPSSCAGKLPYTLWDPCSCPPPEIPRSRASSRTPGYPMLQGHLPLVASNAAPPPCPCSAAVWDGGRPSLHRPSNPCWWRCALLLLVLIPHLFVHHAAASADALRGRHCRLQSIGQAGTARGVRTRPCLCQIFLLDWTSFLLL
jgi:hypothetical protein